MTRGLPSSGAQQPGSAAGSMAAVLEIDALGQRVEERLAQFLSWQLSESPRGSSQRALTEPVADLVLAGGKRVRAALCYWGWRGAGGQDGDAPIAAAAALELLHAFALIHDDVMDASLLRRGRDTVHRHFSSQHAAEGWRGSADDFGVAGAVLAGDLCMVWADMVLREGGFAPDALQRGMAVYDAMRREAIHGQYLDLVAQAEGRATAEDARRVAHGKTAASTTTGPLLFGAALAGANDALRSAYTRYGEPLGEAFQLRDDLLGAFGDPEVTGKPAGDDLRDGKCTALLAHARRTATLNVRARIDELMADRSDDAVAELQQLVTSTGARHFAVQKITELRTRALAAVDTMRIGTAARSVLRTVATTLTTPADPVAALSTSLSGADR